MTPAERVRHLMQAGTVAPDEGERLLAVVAPEPARSQAWLLFNPFDRFGGGIAAVVGAVVSALSVWVTRLGVRFDGFLDLHVTGARIAPLRVSLLEQVAGWVMPALLFWIYTRTVARHARLVDFLGMVGLARLPLLLAAVPIAWLAPAVLLAPTKPTPALMLTVLLALGCVAWNLTLLYQGFKNASGLRGARLVGGFVATVIVAEAASKLLLAILS